MNNTREKLRRHNHSVSPMTIKKKAFKRECEGNIKRCPHIEKAEPGDWKTRPMCLHFPGMVCNNKYHPDANLEDVVLEDL